MDDCECTVTAIKGGEGKRLTYRRTSAQSAGAERRDIAPLV